MFRPSQSRGSTFRWIHWRWPSFRNLWQKFAVQLDSAVSYLLWAIISKDFLDKVEEVIPVDGKKILQHLIGTWIFLSGCFSWMMFGVPKNTHPLGFKQHPNWKMLVVYPIIYRLFCIPGQVVVWDFFHQRRRNVFLLLERVSSHLEPMFKMPGCLSRNLYGIHE